MTPGRLGPEVVGVLAPNPGPMTLTGTNTWVVGDPAETLPVVVDPGPPVPSHLETVLAAAGGRVGAVLVTHRHLDHTESAATLAARVGCGVRAADPTWRVGPDGLAEGDEVALGRARLEVLATPGHTSDSVSLLLTGPSGVRLLTGDTVLGTGTSVISAPDGDLGAYLASLDRLLAVVQEREVISLLPGHGPVLGDPVTALEHYREHRRQRLDQVRAARTAGAVTPEDVVARVYPEVVGTPLQSAAVQSVRAQLEYLRRLDEG